MGWYVVYRPTLPADPELYFCLDQPRDGVTCMSARPREEDDFRPVHDPHFHGVLWHGPFRTREEARTALPSR